MAKTKYTAGVVLLLAGMLLAACGGADNSDSAANSAPASDVQVQPVSGASDTSGAGDASGANAAGAAAVAADVGTGSDGVAGSGGSNQAGGSAAPNSDTVAPLPGEADEASGNITSGTGGGSYSAVSDAECSEIQKQLSQALGVDFNRTSRPAAFTDLTGVSGESCQLTATGTGAQFPNMVETAQRIGQIFTGSGWSADAQYAADSPTGTIGGLRRDNQLAAYAVQWAPADGVTCPADQPISACAETLTPEQMNYTIQIDLAQQ